MISRCRTGLDIGLSESVVHKICAVFARYAKVAEAILYGSRAKGT